MSLPQSIEKVGQLVKLYIDAKHQSLANTKSPISCSVDIDYSTTELSTILHSTTVTPSIDLGTADEDTKKLQNEMTETMNIAAKEFCLSMGLYLVADAFLADIRLSLSDGHNTTKTLFHGIDIGADELASIEKLAILFDIVIKVSPVLPSARTAFFSLLRTVLETLLTISTEVIAIFWYYMESRIDIISTKIFNAKETLDRIALLGTCNHLTDNYYERDNRGKYNSYTKDTFNDTFQARVRSFVATVFNFDDATGLNKLLVLANRQNEEPPLAATKSSDGHLLREILTFQKLLRDPYTYLRSPGQLSAQAESMARLSSYFLDEESKFAKIHPSRDYFEVDSEGKEPATTCDESSVFAPEHYWLSGFEGTKSGETFEQLLKEDTKVALKRFDRSEFRKLLLIQIYMVSCFFLELQASRKDATVKSSRNQTNPKHLIDEVVPDNLAGKFQRIKRETIRLMRTWNGPLLYVLQTVAHSEEYWWSWLIDGRQKGGSELISEDQFTVQDIDAVKKKFEGVAPYKTKKYFNTHATPHLSRRMKVKTGLELLQSGRTMDTNFDAEIERVTKEIESEANDEKRQELTEEKDMLVWKKIKGLRERNWLSLDSLLSADDLVDKAAEKKRLEQETKVAEKVGTDEKESNGTEVLGKDTGSEGTKEQSNPEPTADSEKIVDTEVSLKSKDSTAIASETDPIPSSADGEPVSVGNGEGMDVDGVADVNLASTSDPSYSPSQLDAQKPLRTPGLPDPASAEKEGETRDDEQPTEGMDIAEEEATVPKTQDESQDSLAANQAVVNLQEPESEPKTRTRKRPFEEAETHTRPKRNATK